MKLGIPHFTADKGQKSISEKLLVTPLFTFQVASILVKKILGNIRIREAFK